GPVWTGEVRLNRQWLYQPFDWKKPRRIFVCAHGDLFAENVPDEWILDVFTVMAAADHHTYQVLTKRADRMREFLSRRDLLDDIYANWYTFTGKPREVYSWPLHNVWCGVSAEDQKRADERVPDLLATPAAIRFASAEPLLGPIDFTAIRDDGTGVDDTLRGLVFCQGRNEPALTPRLDWIIVGGESGPGARPMHPDWARSIRDQCAATGVPFFFKQWGEWAPGECAPRLQLRKERVATWFNEQWMFETITPAVGQSLHRDDEPDVYRFGKSGLTRTLDSIEHNAMPEVAAL
ncbi:MAG: phage Gp37/Gp68 family protein, partial [Mesorhizobium sp.]